MIELSSNRQNLPVRLSLTAGQSHDGQAANDLLDHVDIGTIVLADKAYDADRIRTSLSEKDAFANIPQGQPTVETVLQHMALS